MLFSSISYESEMTEIHWRVNVLVKETLQTKHGNDNKTRTFWIRSNEQRGVWSPVKINAILNWTKPPPVSRVNEIANKNCQYEQNYAFFLLNVGVTKKAYRVRHSFYLVFPLPFSWRHEYGYFIRFVFFFFFIYQSSAICIHRKSWSSDGNADQIGPICKMLCFFLK